MYDYRHNTSNAVVFFHFLFHRRINLAQRSSHFSVLIVTIYTNAYRELIVLTLLNIAAFPVVMENLSIYRTRSSSYYLNLYASRVIY